MCATASDCGAGSCSNGAFFSPMCDENGLCIFFQQPCEPPLGCVGSEGCQMGCTSSDECASPSACSPDGGCVLAAGNECSSNAECASGSCVGGTGGSGGGGGPAFTGTCGASLGQGCPTTCAVGLVCNPNQVCKVSPGGACSSDDDCDEGRCLPAGTDAGAAQVCETPAGSPCTVMFSVCVAGASCTSATPAAPTQCLLVSGQPCLSAGDCASMTCTSGVCTGGPGSACATSNDCTAETTCVVQPGQTTGTCLVVTGATCSADAECSTGHCVAGACCGVTCKACQACGSDGMSCQGAMTGMACVANACVSVGGSGWFFSPGGVCDGLGDCQPTQAQSCGGFGCSANGCASSCSATVPCGPNATCVGTSCLLNDGQPCTQNADCATDDCAPVTNGTGKACAP
jgi:hypothetical protein